MDLREVLAEAIDSTEPRWPLSEKVLGDKLIDAVLARLSRPDVLDEFERRVVALLETDDVWSPTMKARRTRLILADMLGGES